MGLAVFWVTCDYADAPGLGVPTLGSQTFGACVTRTGFAARPTIFLPPKKVSQSLLANLLGLFDDFLVLWVSFFFWHIFLSQNQNHGNDRVGYPPKCHGWRRGEDAMKHGLPSTFKEYKLWAQKPVRKG